MAYIEIRTKEDISKIKLGDQFIIDGPVDPEEFFEVYQELSLMVKEYIEKLESGISGEVEKANEIKEKYTVKELKAILKEGGIKGYSKLKEDQLIQLVLDNGLL